MMMRQRAAISELHTGRQWVRGAAVVVLLVLTAVFHWVTPTSQHHLHSLHVVLRKFFIIPIVLAAIWFDVRGALLAAAGATLLYVPHIMLQWAGQSAENVNQIGEIATMWLTGLLAGMLVRSEKGALRKVVETHRGSLMALVAALDAREHETGLHSVRVSDYAVRLGREMGMTREELRALGRASLLHDVGKVGTPDHILLKPGPLSKEEWRLMRQHSGTGRRILLTVPFLRDAAEFVYCHHERYDGTGYPRGLQGEHIPRDARIFVVADVFDALTTDRTYHRKIGCQAAIEEIRKEAGKAFDPTVVEAFLRIPCEEWSRIAGRVAGMQVESLGAGGAGSEE